MTFSDVHRQLEGQVFRHVRRIVRDADDAEDVALCVWIRLARLFGAMESGRERDHSDSGRPPLSTLSLRAMRAFVLTIATRLSLNHLRGGRRRAARLQKYEQHGQMDDNGDQLDGGGTAEADVTGIRAEAERVIASFPPRKKKFARLYFLEGVPSREIAQLCGCNVRYVSTRIAEVRGILAGSITRPEGWRADEQR
jgi:RNA polymerase sigma factor (sigma-70 family)